MGFASPLSHGLFHLSWVHGAWMSRLRITGISASSVAGLLTLWAVSIAICEPQQIHILEIYQIEGGSQVAQAMKSLDATEAGEPFRNLQKHLQQSNPKQAIHRMKVRVIERGTGTSSQDGCRAILALEADERLEAGGVQEALRGWQADSETPVPIVGSDPLAEKAKRWATWKRDIARHQLMLLTKTGDRPEVRKIASAAKLASYQISNDSPAQPVTLSSPVDHWSQLMEEASTLSNATSLTSTNPLPPPNQEAMMCRSTSWKPVAGPVRFGRLLAATTTPLLLWVAYRGWMQFAKRRARKNQSPWTHSLHSMGLLSFGRLEFREETTYRTPKSSQKFGLSLVTGWWLEAIRYSFPLLVLTKAILNPAWGRFFFSQPIAALPKLLEWW